MSSVWKIITLTSIVFITHCYATERPYVYAREYTKTKIEFTEKNPQFESGKPNAIIDGMGHYFFSLLTKLVLWNWKMNNHKISEETKNYLKKYIADNNLHTVKVRFNQYAPLSEWKRLRANRDINPYVKYTVGFFSWLFYTIFPERLFAGFPLIGGGDHYNPYTNTINVYTDLVPVVIHEGGHAKDNMLRQKKTLYSLSYAIPLVPLYHEAIASRDAMSYIHEQEDHKNEIDAYKQLSPAYGTYIGGGLGDIINSSYGIVMVIPGHIYGRIKARNLKRKYEEESKLSKTK